MERYKLNSVMIPNDNGQWVKFEDATSEIIKLQNRIKVLETDKDYFRKKLTKRSLSGDEQ